MTQHQEHDLVATSPAISPLQMESGEAAPQEIALGDEPQEFDAPKHGRPIFLIGAEEGQNVMAYWRETRKYVPGEGWQQHAFWAIWRGSDPVPFEPVAWSEAD